jgi:hypothetical protein
MLSIPVADDGCVADDPMALPVDAATTSGELGGSFRAPNGTSGKAVAGRANVG